MPRCWNARDVMPVQRLKALKNAGGLGEAELKATSLADMYKNSSLT